jgi:hypothetical protein
MLQTECTFTLPVGLTDSAGDLHQEGTMRLATARDEIEPLRDPMVRENPAYLSILLLARVVTRIGELHEVTPSLIEGLYAADFDHLQRLYERLNCDPETLARVTCPNCAEEIDVDLRPVEDAWLGN